LKSHLKSSSYRKLWNSIFSLPFFVMDFWKSLTNWSLAVNLDDLVALIPFPASQVEMVKVEIVQGSRIVNMEKSSIVYSFLVRAHSLQVLRIERRSTPRINRSILDTFLFDAITSVKRSTPSFSRSAPHHGRLFRPLSPIVISVTVIRRHDIVLPSISATVFTTPRSRELTLSSSVLYTPET
jgi:hypothetical protein